ncbi:MAG: hypothetical protein M1831_004671 [Alyxoria varia]|nr:MAG: hypothetical protein M1831_000800 [Alyxoria varia]KAI9656100.1 MAG: hypothetical protein M1831_004671 [Alyxoria varia]
MPSPSSSPTLSPRSPVAASASSGSNSNSSQNDKQPAPDGEPMQIFVKDPSEEVTTLTVPPSTSIATLKSLVALQHPHLQASGIYPSSNTRLTFAGRHLDCPDKPLRDYNIPPGSTLNLALPSAAGAEGSSVEATGTAEQAEPQALAPSVTGETAPDAAPSNAEVKSDAGITQAKTQPTPPPEQPPATTSQQSKDETSTPAPFAAPSQSISAPAPAPKTASSSKPPPKKRGPRCNLPSCSALAQRIVGECGFCGSTFCAKHRLLESHSCKGLEEAKSESKERNKERLEGERTVAGVGL